MTDIAHGVIEIELRDDRAEADLRRLEADFDRAMSRISQADATVNIEANLKQLKADLKKAEAEVERWEQAVDRGATKYRKNRLAEATDARRIAQRKHADAVRELEDIRRAAADRQLEARAVALVEKREAALERIREAAHKRYMARMNQQWRFRDRMNRQREREITQAERAAYAMQREMDEVPALERAYAKLHDRINALQIAKGKLHRKDSAGIFRIELEQNDLAAQAERISKTVFSRTGRKPVSIPVEYKLSERAGDRVRLQLMQNNSVLLATAAALGADIGGQLSRGIGLGFQKAREKGIGGITADLSGAAVRGTFGVLSKIGHAVAGLGDMTVRLGPFTTTIRKLMVGLSLFAPMLLDVVGGLGALVGSVGSAALGLGALGVAVGGGLIPAFAGLFMVLKPVVGEFKNAMKASKAYNDAVLKHGKGSDQAKKKLDEFKNVMKGQSAATKEAFLNAGKLRDAWAKATEPARLEAFKTIGEGLNFASRNMRWFKDNTNEGMRVLGTGLRGVMQNLDTNAFNVMGQNFNRFLGPVISGVGKLINYFARVGAAASRALPQMGEQFDRWAGKIEGTSHNLSDLQTRVNGVIDSTKKLGAFFMAAGRLTKAFFGAGVDSGNDFTTTMTNAMNRWTAFLNTTQGQSKLKDFFAESVKGVQALWSVIAPIAKSFVMWAEALAPISRALFSASGAVSQFVAGLLQVTALRGPITALATTLGTMWAVGKIGAAANALVNFSRALLGVSAAQKAVAASSAAAAGAQALGGAAGAASTLSRVGAAAPVAATAAKATVAQRAFTALTGAGTALAASLGATSTVAAGLATGGLALVAGAAVYGAYKFFTMKSASDKLRDGIKQSSQQVQQARGEYIQLRTGLANTAMGYQQASVSVDQARHNLKLANEEVGKAKKGSDAHRAAILNQRQAMLDLRAAQQNEVQTRAQWNTQSKQIQQAADREVNGTRERYQQTIKLAEAEKTRLQFSKRHATTPAMVDAINKKIAEQDALIRKAGNAHNAALNQQAAAGLNAARAWRGMEQIVGQAEQRLGALRRQAKGAAVAQQVALKFQAPSSVSNVSAAATKALSRGVSQRVVMKIIADSKSAEEAIRRLQRIGLPPKKQRVSESGSAGVRTKLEAIRDTKLAEKRQKIAESGGQNVVQTLARILGVKIGPKTARIIAQDAATSTINAIINKKIADKHFNIWAHNLSTGARKAQGGPVVAAASGWGATTLERKQNRAATEAGMRTPQRTNGGVYKQPQYLIGEERRPEVVIASNPAYRKQNKDYLRTAARMLGMKAYDPHQESGYEIRAAGGFSPFMAGDTPKPFSTTTVSKRTGKSVTRRTFGAPGGPGKALSQGQINAFGKRQKGKKIAKLKNANRGRWSAYVGTLSHQRDLWEDELDLRERATKEPVDWLVDSGEKLNPADPESPAKMVPNTAAISEYAAGLAKVKEAVAQIGQIVAALVSAIPKAMQEASYEISLRKGNKKQLEAAIAANKPGLKSKDDKVKKRAQDRISRYQDLLREENDGISEASSDRKTLREQGEQEKFNVRRNALDMADVDARIATTTKGAVDKQVAEANAQGGSGGGSGDTGGGAGESQSALNSANAEIARLKGVNATAALGNILAGSSDLSIGGAIGSRASAMPGAGGVAGISSGPRAAAAKVGAVGSDGAAAPRVGDWQGPGAAAPTGGSGGSVININTLHPGDPATLQAIGAAATGGIGMQGYVSSNTERTGL